jgi:hypothetical protein
MADLASVLMGEKCGGWAELGFGGEPDIDRLHAAVEIEIEDFFAVATPAHGQSARTRSHTAFAHKRGLPAGPEWLDVEFRIARFVGGEGEPFAVGEKTGLASWNCVVSS